MTKVQLNQKEQHYADTRKEAEEIVEHAKENEFLMMNKITEKYNKYGQYFLVDLTYQHNTPKDDTPEGQLSIEDVHEGVEYAVEQDGSVSVATKEEAEQKSTDELEQDLPF